MIPKLCVLFAVAATVAAPPDRVLAFKYVGSNVYLVKLDARTLQQLPGKPLLVSRTDDFDWDFSPDGTHLVVAAKQARVVDLARFRVHVECCLPIPVGSPSFAGLAWTHEGIVELDDGGGTWNLHGTGVSPNAPFSVAAWAKGPSGLVELYAEDDPTPAAVRTWSFTPSTDAAAPASVPELDGESTVALATGGGSIYLMTPAGKLVVVGPTATRTRSISLPATSNGAFRLTAWPPGRLVATTEHRLVVIDPETGVSRALRDGATDFVTGGGDLVAWNRLTKGGLFVYDRNGILRFRLLTGSPTECVAIHYPYAYVGCWAQKRIVDLETRRVIGRVKSAVSVIDAGQ